jgi:ubiquinone/menaquinone biosynthesis C-methylase UbiE
LFGTKLERLEERRKQDINNVIEKVKKSSHLYNWNFYKSVEGLMEYRTLALKRFTSDYYNGISEERYINAALPVLPFEDKSFDLVLSGHFLFTYADKFDFNFHLSSILELFRVSRKEVRIYPLQQGMISQPYKQMTELLSCLKKLHIEYEIIPVQFEFQKGSNKMLRLIH